MMRIVLSAIVWLVATLSAHTFPAPKERDADFTGKYAVKNAAGEFAIETYFPDGAYLYECSKYITPGEWSLRNGRVIVTCGYMRYESDAKRARWHTTHQWVAERWVVIEGGPIVEVVERSKLP
jgi:mannose-6-phosphate isomerase-like protein (cupin superfamily)